MKFIGVLILIIAIIVVYKVLRKKREYVNLERRDRKLDAELEKERKLDGLFTSVSGKEKEIAELKAKRTSNKTGQVKEAYGKAKRILGDFGKAYNGFRRFIGVDTTKSKY